MSAETQPLGGEGGGDRDGQAPAIDRGGEHRGGLGQPVEGFAQRRQRDLGGVGEQQALGGAFEQRSPDIVLEILDLLADRARRHRQLVGGAAEVQMAGRGLEGAQRIERRQPAAFHSFPKRLGRSSCLRIGA
jgi:hypothetical protein